MEDVEGIHHAARLLLDAMEPGPMPEDMSVVLYQTFPFIFELASLLGIAVESIIENTLYSGVVILHVQIPRIEISGKGPPQAYDDEY